MVMGRIEFTHKSSLMNLCQIKVLASCNGLTRAWQRQHTHNQKARDSPFTQQAALQRNLPQPWVSGLIMAEAMDVAIAGTLPSGSGI